MWGTRRYQPFAKPAPDRDRSWDLGGAVPHEAARDPEELPVVQRAAVALAERASAN